MFRTLADPPHTSTARDDCGGDDAAGTSRLAVTLDAAATDPPAFRIPFARTAQGERVRPEDGTTGPFTCPDCKTGVSLRRAHMREGSPVRAHFAHRPAIDCGFSYGEGELHLLAKGVAATAVNERRPVALLRACARCQRITEQRMPERVARATLEYRLPSGRRADVALLDQAGELLAIIEVLESHAVDAVKRADLVGLRWCEIQARDIVAAAGAAASTQRWPLAQDELLPFTCRPCRFSEVRAWQGSARLQVECPLPTAGTVLAVEACGGCPYYLDVSTEGIRCWGGGAK